MGELLSFRLVTVISLMFGWLVSFFFFPASAMDGVTSRSAIVITAVVRMIFLPFGFRSASLIDPSQIGDLKFCFPSSIIKIPAGTALSESDPDKRRLAFEKERY